MDSHYFVNDDNLGSKPALFDYAHGKHAYAFATDSGVFSKSGMDANSELLLQSIREPRGSLLDLGCGYGCVGIVLAKEYGLTLTMADVNMRAVRLAEINARRNGLAAEAVVSDGYAKIHGEFETITLNPPIKAGKKTVYALYEGAVLHMRRGGKFYVVISKRHGAESTRRKLAEVFGNCETICKRSGSFVYCCERLSIC